MLRDEKYSKLVPGHRTHTARSVRLDVCVPRPLPSGCGENFLLQHDSSAKYTASQITQILKGTPSQPPELEKLLQKNGAISNAQKPLAWAEGDWPSDALGTRKVSWCGMDALVNVCSWDMDAIMVWAWMHCQPFALGTRTLFWLGHGCTGPGNRMPGTQTLLWVAGMDAQVVEIPLEPERQSSGLSMDAPVTVCSWNTNANLVWAWMHL